MEIFSDLIVSPIQIKLHCIAAGMNILALINLSTIFLFRLLNPSSSYRSQLSDDDDQSSITNHPTHETHLFKT